MQESIVDINSYDLAAATANRVRTVVTGEFCHRSKSFSIAESFNLCVTFGYQASFVSLY